MRTKARLFGIVLCALAAAACGGDSDENPAGSGGNRGKWGNRGKRGHCGKRGSCDVDRKWRRDDQG